MNFFDDYICTECIGGLLLYKFQIYLSSQWMNGGFTMVSLRFTSELRMCYFLFQSRLFLILVYLTALLRSCS